MIILLFALMMSKNTSPQTRVYIEHIIYMKNIFIFSNYQPPIPNKKESQHHFMAVLLLVKIFNMLEETKIYST